jgi:urease accessory protein UreE
MLNEELDLPYLDVMEREYAKTFRRIAPDHANLLRSRFVRALNDQREYLIQLVRNVLQEQDGNALQLEPENETENISQHG